MKIIQPARYKNKKRDEIKKQGSEAKLSLSETKLPLKEHTFTESDSLPKQRPGHNKPRKKNTRVADSVSANVTPKVVEYEQSPELPKGKKRRRSELAAPASTEPISLSLDPGKKEFNQVFERGIRLLSMREHSTKEIANKLLEKSESSDVVYAVIDELLKNKYLSDERFTESFVRSRANKGHGPVKIKAELKNKGISNTLIEEHLDESAAIWFDKAEQQYQKKYGQAPVSDYKEWAKRARFMQSRGFTSEHIQCAIEPFSSND